MSMHKRRKRSSRKRMQNRAHDRPDQSSRTARRPKKYNTFKSDARSGTYPKGHKLHVAQVAKRKKQEAWLPG